MATLAGKVVLVTGASSGIGRASCIAAAREGAKVVACARRVDEGEETARLACETGGECVFLRADVSDPSDVEELIRGAVERFGRLDCALNNAGVGSAEEGKNVLLTADYSEETFRRVIDINLMGCWFCMKQEIQQMVDQGGGSIVNISSVLGLIGGRTAGPYAASKHAVLGLTKCAALEYASKGIRVNAICPGFIERPMTELFTEERRKAVLAYTPMHRPGTPEEVANLAVWLLSDASSFVTGSSYVVDGGLLAG